MCCSGSKYGPVAGSCRYDKKPSGSLKGAEFLDYLRDCYVQNMHCLPRKLVNSPVSLRYRVVLVKNCIVDLFVCLSPL